MKHHLNWQLTLILVPLALFAPAGCSSSSEPGDGGAGAGGSAEGGEPPSDGLPGAGGIPVNGSGGASEAGAPMASSPGGMTGDDPSAGTSGGGAGGDQPVGGAGGDAGASDAGAGGDAGAAGAGGDDPFASCDYFERLDADNDINAEDTTVVLSRPFTICGQIDPDHFNGTRVDRDRFYFYLDTLEASLIYKLEAYGAGAVADIGVEGQDGSSWALGHGKTVIMDDDVLGNQIRVAVSAFDDIALDQPIKYRLRISLDDPQTRCPRAAAAADYVEAGDGPSNDGNDVFTNDEEDVLFTSSTADEPEPTDLTIASGSQYRITGTAADVTIIGSYIDADTYEIHTGPTTDQLTIRADWPGSTRDFDFLIANADSEEIIAGGTVYDPNSEYRTFVVLPNTTYWVWLAAYWQSTGSLPVDYDLTICGETYDFGD